jgi:hypothetical protein
MSEVGNPCFFVGVYVSLYNGLAGFAQGVTLGLLTPQRLGIGEYVDTCATAFSVGSGVGTVVSYLTSAGLARMVASLARWQKAVAAARAAQQRYLQRQAAAAARKALPNVQVVRQPPRIAPRMPPRTRGGRSHEGGTGGEWF